MDKLNNHLNPHTQQPYHPTIRAAMKLARNKINRYYSMTDLSSAYRIAMGKYFNLLILIMYLSTDNQLVLHPGLKLEYFRQKEWDEEWIDNAEDLAREVYVTCYEGKGDPIMATSGMTADAVSHLQI